VGREALIKCGILLLLSLALLVLPVWFYGAVDKDEPKYLESAKEMLETGDYITPRFNCKPRPDKPILIYWIILAGYKLFGRSPGAGRFFVAMSGVFTLLSLFVWMLKRFGLEEAFWGALTLLSTLEFMLMNSVAMPDAVLLLFITLAVLSFYEQHHTLGTLFCALAFLTKGPVGVVLPLIIARPKGAFSLKNLFLFLMVAMPWYVVVALKEGISFVEKFFLFHNLTRFARGIPGHPSQWWYYLVNSLWIFLPVTPLIPVAVLRGFRDGGEKRFCSLWVLLVLAFFQMAKTKLPHYLLPSLPPISALVGVYFCRTDWYKRLILGFLGLALCLKFFAVPIWDLARRDLDAARLVLALSEGRRVYFYKYYSPAMIFNTGLCIDRIGRDELFRMVREGQRAIVIASLRKIPKKRVGKVVFVYRPLLLGNPVAIINLQKSCGKGDGHAETGIRVRLRGSGSGTPGAEGGGSCRLAYGP